MCRDCASAATPSRLCGSRAVAAAAPLSAPRGGAPLCCLQRLRRAPLPAPRGGAPMCCLQRLRRAPVPLHRLQRAALLRRLLPVH